MNDASAVRQKIQDAFSAVSRPSIDELTPHRCQECDALRDALAPFTVNDVPLEVLREHVFDLPLLSAKAKQYYLPAWLYAALGAESWNYADAAITNIDSDERFDPPGYYTDAQWEAILGWLAHLEATEESVTQGTARNAATAIRRRGEA
jgi:hypothetical protein